MQIGKEQAGKFQDIPITVKVADAISTFGVYIKYFVQCEEAQGPSVSVARGEIASYLDLVLGTKAG